MSSSSIEKSIIQRLILVRTKYSGSRGKSSFARELGISPSTYVYYEQGRMPPISLLLKICDLTKTDIHWLLTGSDYKSTNSDCALKYESEPILRKTQTLLKANPACSKALESFVDLLLSDYDKQASRNRLSHPGLIPILGRTAAGIPVFWSDVLPKTGPLTELPELVRRYTGKEIHEQASGNVQLDIQSKFVAKNFVGKSASIVQVKADNEIVQFVDCGEISSQIQDCFALQVDGDSMAPRIKDGDIVVLSPSIRAGQGQIAVIQLQNQIGVTCKILRTEGDKMHLIPINEKFDTKVVPHTSLSWALAVLFHISM